jgi:3-hydroxyisobutyrate dehydrogenase
VIADYLRGVNLLALSEMLRLGDRFGLAQDFVLHMSEELGHQDAHGVVLREVVSRRFQSGTSLGMIRQNIELVAKLALALQVSAPLLDATRAAWRDADSALGSGADHTAIIRWLEGLQPPEKQDDGASTA